MSCFSEIALSRNGVGSLWCSASSNRATQAYSVLAENSELRAGFFSTFSATAAFFATDDLRNSSNARPGVMFDHVQPALLLVRPGPPAGPLVPVIFDRGRTRPAADARVPLVVQRVVRDVVLQDELPHVLLGPPQERVHLHEIELRVPLNNGGRLAVVSLVAADGTDPGVVPLHRVPQR